jgi:hypothetical protein
MVPCVTVFYLDGASTPFPILVLFKNGYASRPMSDSQNCHPIDNIWSEVKKLCRKPGLTSFRESGSIPALVLDAWNRVVETSQTRANDAASRSLATFPLSDFENLDSLIFVALGVHHSSQTLQNRGTTGSEGTASDLTLSH